jgi:hypothetical protein
MNLVHSCQGDSLPLSLLTFSSDHSCLQNQQMLRFAQRRENKQATHRIIALSFVASSNAIYE